jgi:hypothetical protein
MTVGALLQYKENYYGRYHPKLPNIPFATHNFLSSTHQGSWDAFTLMQTRQTLSQVQVVRKKFILFCAQAICVPHPKIPLIGCNYLKCFISDPYVNGETIDGWVQERWVEPLNELPTYQEEHMKTIRDMYVSLSKEGRKRTPEQMYEFFQEMQKAKNE